MSQRPKRLELIRVPSPPGQDATAVVHHRVTPSSRSQDPFIHLDEERQQGVEFLV